MAQANKICEVCHTLGHSKFYCKTRRPTKIKQYGKKADEWAITRIEWFKANASHDGYYYCHYCGKPMVMSECTLDHVKPKGSHVELRLDHSNLVPCCLWDNQRKGSRSYKSYCGEFYPHLLQ